MDTPGLRQRLAQRLDAFPLLRILVLDRAFLYAFLTLVFLTGSIAVAVPKLWRSGPDLPGRPRFRISLIDIAQAWSLARTARAAAAEGRHDAAVQAWRSALVNNPGNARIHQGVLEFLRDSPIAPTDDVVLAAITSSWYPYAAGTNLATLELTTVVLEKYRLASQALERLEAAADPAQPAWRALKARCLMPAARPGEFDALWRSNAQAFATDPILAIHRDAWLAGWERGTEAIEAMVRLKERLPRPGNEGLTAARLLFIAAARRGSPEDMQAALSRLAEARADAVSHHAQYWRALAALSRFDEARRLALGFRERSSPRLAPEVAEYAATLAALGIPDEAIAYLDQVLPRFENHPAVWEVYLSILADARRWNELRRATARVRTATASFETARIIALFAEYRAEISDQRATAARLLAEQLAKARILDGSLALRIAAELLRDGNAAAARDLLLNKRREMRDQPPYWNLLFQAALSLRDSRTMADASAEQLRLQPNHPLALSNRAAMLIGIEDEPAEALEITLRLVTDFPHSVPFQINHAFALMLNGRVEEAAALLDRVDPGRLERQAASAFHFARADVAFRQGDFARALREADEVRPALILPPQVDRLDLIRRQSRDNLP